MLILSVIVYLSLFVMMYICAKSYSAQKCRLGNSSVIYERTYGSYTPIFIAILIYSIIFGMRFGVGTDHYSYYLEYQDGDFSIYEVGYGFIGEFFKFFGLPFPFYFGFVALIQILPFFIVFKRFKHDIYLYLVYSLIFSTAWLSISNGLRQWVAIGIIFYATTFLNRRDWWRYLIAVLFSSLFHSSAVIMLLLLPYAFAGPFFNNSKFKLIVLAVSVFFGYQISANQWFDHVNYLLTLSNFSGFDKYDYYLEQGFDQENGALGIGYFLNLLTCFAFVSYSEKAKSFYNNRWMGLLFDLYFIGCVFNYVLSSVHVLSRVNMYFFGWSFVIYALSIYAAVKLKDMKMKYILGFLVFMSFPANLYRADENQSQFYFFWWTDIMPIRFRSALIN